MPKVKVDVRLPSMDSLLKEIQTRVVQTVDAALDEYSQRLLRLLQERIGVLHQAGSLQLSSGPVEPGDYAGRLEVLREDTESGFSYTVGFPAGAVHAPSGVPLVLVARRLEFGTKTNPNVPHWAPVWKRVVVSGRMADDVASRIFDAIRSLS